MSRPTNQLRGARMAAAAAERALQPLPLFPGITTTPELAAEWRGILAAARAEIELEEAMAALLEGRRGR